MTTNLTFKQVLAILNGSGKLRTALLAQLSDLTTADMAEFKAAWGAIADDRRLEIARRLVVRKAKSTLVDFDPLFIHMLSDPLAQVRQTAVEGLEEPTTTSPVAPVLALVDTDEDVEVRAWSARVLANYVFLSLCGLTPRQDADRILPRLMRLLEDEATPAGVRRYALLGAAYAPDERIHTMIAVAYDSDDMATQAGALAAMGVTGDTRWSTVIADEMISPFAYLRQAATEAAGDLGDPELLANLLKILEDKEPELELTAVKAVGKIGGEIALGILEELLEEADDAELVQTIEDALEEMEWNQGLQDLLLLDVDPDKDQNPPAPFSVN